jgi:hypothetical protein
LSADSAAGIVPSSEFDSKFLRRAWFVPLCSEMPMHRSVLRTHTSTARVGRIGSSSERVLDTGTRGGAERAPSSCCTDTRNVTSDSHARARAATVRARRWRRHLRGARTRGLTKRTERVRTYHGTHGTAAPIGYKTFSQRGRRVLGGDSRAYGYRGRWGVVRARAGPRRLEQITWNGSRSMVRLPDYSHGTRRVLAGYSWARAWNDMGRGSGTGRAAHSQRVHTEHEHAMGYCQRYRVPHGAGPLPGGAASVLTATCGEGTRTAVRR